MGFYNVPSEGALTREEALRKFARRNTPERGNRVRFTEAEFERVKKWVEGICYQGDYGSEIFISWDEMTATDLNLILE